MFWGDIWSRGYRYADTFICLDHDPILRGLKTVVSRAVAAAPLGQLSWPLSHSATHFLNLARLGIVGAHLMTTQPQSVLDKLWW